MTALLFAFMISGGLGFAVAISAAPNMKRRAVAVIAATGFSLAAAVVAREPASYTLAACGLSAAGAAIGPLLTTVAGV